MSSASPHALSDTIEAVTLDFFDTLIFHREGPGRGRALVRYLEREGLEPGDWEHAVLYDVFDEHDTMYSPTLPEPERKSYLDRFALRVLERLQASPDRGTAARHADALWEILGPAAFGVFEEVPAVVAELRSRGYPLAILSNWQRGLSHFCVELGLYDAFDHVVCSAEVGSDKPDRGIFDEASSRLGVAHERILHVGDTFVDDYEGGTAAGVNVLLVDRDGRHGQREVGSINDLRELLEILPGPPRTAC